jgi:hypothetical protein
MKRKILHVQVGNEDWEPTEEELNDVAEMFNKAIINDTNSGTVVLTTREGVKVIGVIDVDDDLQIAGVLVTRPTKAEHFDENLLKDSNLRKNLLRREVLNTSIIRIPEGIDAYKYIAFSGNKWELGKGELNLTEFYIKGWSIEEIIMEENKIMEELSKTITTHYPAGWYTTRGLDCTILEDGRKFYYEILSAMVTTEW